MSVVGGVAHGAPADPRPGGGYAAVPVESTRGTDSGVGYVVTRSTEGEPPLRVSVDGGRFAVHGDLLDISVGAIIGGLIGMGIALNGPMPGMPPADLMAKFTRCQQGMSPLGG